MPPSTRLTSGGDYGDRMEEEWERAWKLFSKKGMRHKKT